MAVAILELYEGSKSSELTEEDYLNVAEHLVSMQPELRRLKKAEETLKDILKARGSGKFVYELENHRVTKTAVSGSSRIDYKALAKDHPELVEEYRVDTLVPASVRITA